jgi:YcaO-like protein with predicted kinase domain
VLRDTGGSIERTGKGFTRGTHRSCSPGETWERIRPHFYKAGLTRGADITGLDLLGIPVTLACRPDSPTMASSTGKGLTLEAALVSGAMEAMELYHAEHVELPVLRGSYAEMARRGPVPALEDLPLTRHSVFTASTRDQWVVGHDLCSGGDVAVPYGLVALWDPAFEWMGHRRFQAGIQASSNGLASGNGRSEAITAAILEVIERDAVTSYMMAELRTGCPPPRVRLDTVTAPLARELLDRLEAADITVVLRDCRGDTDVPVYLCHLYDQTYRHMGMCLGYGAHLDPEIAMVRAVTEAVQARVVVVAGSRDDIFRRGLRGIRLADTRTRFDAATRAPASVDASELVSEATETFEGDIDLLLARLQQVGLNQVIVFDLSRPDFPFSVVRVVVPGLEGHMFEQYAPGRRAQGLPHVQG